MQIKEFKSVDTFINESVIFIKDICNSNNSTTYISLSGGNTPSPIYRALSSVDLDFSKISFFQVDERYISYNGLDSNYRMINDNLISKINSEFHFFDTTLSIQDSLNKYEKELERIPNKKFHLTILGVGSDGHTASLFPNSNALSEDRLVAHTTTDIFNIKDRLTITYKMILNSETILILLKGEDKRKILKKISENKQSYIKYPIMKVLEHNNVTIHFVK